MNTLQVERNKWKDYTLKHIDKELSFFQTHKETWHAYPLDILDLMRVEIESAEIPMPPETLHFVNVQMICAEMYYNQHNLQHRLIYLRPILNGLHFLKTLSETPNE